MFCRLSTAVVAFSMFALLIASLPAAAEEDEPDYARGGFYVGVGAEVGFYTGLDDDIEDALESGGFAVSVDTDDAIGFDLLAGYRVHPQVAVELEFEMLPSADVHTRNSGLGSVDLYDIETWTLTGNLKFFPITGRVQPFLIGGLGLHHANIEDKIALGVDESDTSLALRVGGGLDVYITEHVVVWARTTYLYPTGDLVDLDTSYVSTGGGLQYRF